MHLNVGESPVGLCHRLNSSAINEPGRSRPKLSRSTVQCLSLNHTVVGDWSLIYLKSSHNTVVDRDCNGVGDWSLTSSHNKYKMNTHMLLLQFFHSLFCFLLTRTPAMKLVWHVPKGLQTNEYESEVISYFLASTFMHGAIHEKVSQNLCTSPSTRILATPT